MIFTQPMISVTFQRRYKRFLTDVTTEDGQLITVHCPNSGSMKTCQGEGWQAYISDSQNPKRKLQYTLEMVHNGICWIGVNTQRPNEIAYEAVQEGIFASLRGLSNLRREVKYGSNSRIDLLAEDGKRKVYIEVKNVTLVEDDVYYFPDAVTTRGQKHLNDLMGVVAEGHRAVMLYTIQRSDGSVFKPARHIDPAYADLLKEAIAKGVEILPALVDVTPESLRLTGETVPYELI